MFRLFLLFSNSLLAWGINSPWVHLDSLIKSSIGADPCVSVQDFQDTTASITINVCDTAMAQALALVMKPTYQAGRKVTLIVVDPNGNTVTPASDPGSDAQTLIEDSLHAALDNNPFFRKLVPAQGYIPVFVEFRRKVIQFWDDNEADPNGNSTYAAQEVFSQVLQSTYFGRIRVGTTTAK